MNQNEMKHGMQQNHFDEMFALEDSYWWFIGRRHLVATLIKTYARASSDQSLQILDAGCGTGGTLDVVAHLGCIHGCDIAAAPLAYCAQRGHENLAACSVTELAYANEAFDVVISCDVLEHIDTDVEAMREMQRVIRPGGILIATVPAHKFLWSEHDEALAHVRRYERKEFISRLQEAGYSIEKLSAAVSFVFPVILAFRLLQRVRPKPSDQPDTDLRILPKPINNVLIALLKLEAWLMKFMNLPVGTSLVVVARKSEEVTRPQ